MKVNINNDHEIVQEVFQILLEHLETSKVMQFWSICKLGNGNYLELKDKLFAEETVNSLYEKIKVFQNETLAKEQVNNEDENQHSGV
jgi:hypothetical protein